MKLQVIAAALAMLLACSAQKSYGQHNEGRTLRGGGDRGGRGGWGNRGGGGSGGRGPQGGGQHGGGDRGGGDRGQGDHGRPGPSGQFSRGDGRDGKTVPHTLVEEHGSRGENRQDPEIKIMTMCDEASDKIEVSLRNYRDDLRDQLRLASDEANQEKAVLVAKSPEERDAAMQKVDEVKERGKAEEGRHKRARDDLGPVQKAYLRCLQMQERHIETALKTEKERIMNMSDDERKKLRAVVMEEKQKVDDSEEKYRYASKEVSENMMSLKQLLGEKEERNEELVEKLAEEERQQAKSLVEKGKMEAQKMRAMAHREEVKAKRELIDAEEAIFKKEDEAIEKAHAAVKRFTATREQVAGGSS